MGCFLTVRPQAPANALGQSPTEAGLGPRKGKGGLKFSCSLWIAKNMRPVCIFFVMIAYHLL